jgi:hypothetical protein
MTLTDSRLRAIGTTLTLVLTGVLLWFTLTPAVEIPMQDGRDKLWHMAGFAALVFPVAVTRSGWPWRALLLAVLLAAALGALIEVIQPHVGRSGEWGDALANLAGALIGALAGRRLAPGLRARLVRV